MYNEKEVNDFINDYKDLKKQESKIVFLAEVIVIVVFTIAFFIMVITLSNAYPETSALEGMTKVTETIKFAVTTAAELGVGVFIVVVGPLFVFNRKFQKCLAQREVLVTKMTDVLDENSKDIDNVEISVTWPKSQDEMSIVVSIGKLYNNSPHNEIANIESIKSKISKILNDNTQLFDIEYKISR